MAKATIRHEKIVIPTYKVFPPEKNPLFIEKRAYQGSTGKVYPFPVTEKIADVKEDQEYDAVILENEYLYVMILPELGGRIQRALDKTNNYDFVYYNHVIKPALVGLAGPWISGGIEFNWPQHHRPSTFSPVDHLIAENPDGSVTVHLSEIDQMYGTKGMASITLYPGKAYIEIKGKLFNHTDLPQTFLWWANPAVPVNDNTYSVFPPDVTAVMDHGRRAVSDFPIATGEYYKYDYSAGVDISRYKNIKVPTSYMAAHSDFDFIGNYDEGVQAGLLHVADHHVSPGKKQWTWGNDDFGRSWDRNLTDEDGPYIELMTGVFTDNQPDFTWLKPGEEKNFVQYFMPYKGLGRVSNATKEAAVGITEDTLKVYASASYEQARILVKEQDQVLLDTTADLSPELCYTTELPKSKKLTDVTVTVSHNGRTLVSYKVYEEKLVQIPDPAEYMKDPVDMKTNEELFLAGTHLEQYRHATYEPMDYYDEGLRRDPSDFRINNAKGLLLMRRGHVEASIEYFRKAIEKQTWKNSNPYSGECYYNLGLALEATGRYEEAYDAFYKATWSAETQMSGFYHMALIRSRLGDPEQALTFVEESLIRGWHNMKARTLKAALLRRLGHDVTTWIQESLAIDPMYIGLLFEQAKAEPSTDWTGSIQSQDYFEYASDYAQAGMYEEACEIISAMEAPTPMTYYYQGYYLVKLGQEDAAREAFAAAEKLPSDYCFPNRVPEIEILTEAIDTMNQAPMAHYYLGNLLYDKKQYELAAVHWTQATKEKPELSPALRGLAIYYANKKQDNETAWTYLYQAAQADPEYPRIWLELDQLASRLKMALSDRIAIMESHLDVVNGRDDLVLRYLTLLNDTGRYEEAYDLIMSHTFHPWEGGEGKVTTQYRFSLIQMARKILDQNPEKAIELLTATLTYPDNLGEGKLFNVPDNEAWYYIGEAWTKLGNAEKAKGAYKNGASGSQEPSGVLYYNDMPSDYIYYQGLSYRALGDEHGALKSFHQLIRYGEKHIFDKVAYDFFAVSLPEIEIFQDDIVLRNSQYCNYLRGLGHMGVGEFEKACQLFDQVLQNRPDDQGTLLHRSML